MVLMQCVPIKYAMHSCNLHHMTPIVEVGVATFVMRRKDVKCAMGDFDG